MEKFSSKRIAIDNSIVNWKAGQGLHASIQNDPPKHRDYQAIEQLFDLQEKGQVILVAVDQLDRESKKTSCTERRNKLIETVKLCKEKWYLTRFEALSKSKQASKSAQESGINLGDGARWVTKSDMRKIEKYIALGVNDEERVDLEVLATAARWHRDLSPQPDCRPVRSLLRLLPYVPSQDHFFSLGRTDLIHYTM